MNVAFRWRPSLGEGLRIGRTVLGGCLVVGLSLLPSDGQAEAAETAEVVLKVKKLRNAEGQLLVLLYRSEAGFPTKPGKAWKRYKVRLSAKQGQKTLRDLPPGRYAISVIHDENSNGEIDTNWIGMPKEGVAASNNAQGFMGPPKFEDAAFNLSAGLSQTLNVNMVYL